MENLETIIDKYRENISKRNKSIYSVFLKPISEKNIFSDKDVKQFLKKDLDSHSILKKKSNLFENDELFDVLNNFEYNNLPFLYYLKEQGKVELFWEAVYLANKNIFENSLKYNIEFYKYPNFTKKYRKFCKIEVEKILDEGLNETKKCKEISKIKNILSLLKKVNNNQRDNNEYNNIGIFYK